MGKRPAPGKCVHCLKHCESLTWDHVLPRSWYPDSTPANLERWQVPACGPCNKTIGRVEEDLLLRFAMCVDPNSPDLGQLVERVLRSVRPSAGKNPRDRAARVRNLNRILRETTVTAKPPSRGVLPGFGPHAGVKYKSYTAVNIRKEDLQRVAVKIARGVTFKLKGLYVDPSWEITFHPAHGPTAESIERELLVGGETYTWGPALSVRHAPATDNPAASLIRLDIWHQLKLYLIVLPPERVSNRVHR